MLQFTDLEARPGQTAQPDYFLAFPALDTSAKSCFGLTKGRADRRMREFC
jgi:hypothetical protein